jgi:hypothetical protein
VSPNVDFQYQKLRKFQYSLAIEFKSCLNRTSDLTQLWRQGQLDRSATIQALKEIEQNAKRQSQLLEKLLNWDFAPSEDHQFCMSS